MSTLLQTPKRALKKVALVGFAITLALSHLSEVRAKSVDVYFGSSSHTEVGIFHSQMNLNNGVLTATRQVHDLYDVKFLTSNPDKSVLYAVAKQAEPQIPVVAAFSIKDNGQLMWLNSVPVNDTTGVHIAVHPRGRFLLTAHYSGHSISVFPIQSDGKVGEKSQSFKHSGGSRVVAGRQEKPHPHWVGFSPDGRFAFVPDLGKDQVVIYQVNKDETKLSTHGAADLPAGGGPRHMRFSKDGRFIFVLNELQLSVSTLSYNAEKGTATLVSTTPTLSTSIKEKETFNSASEIVVHPSGRFVYTGNRGHDSVSVFQVDESSGKLTLLEVESIRGSWPRNINLSPEGNWLLAAGAKSNTVSTFAVDNDSGELSFPTGNVINVPEPITIEFGRVKP